MNVKLNCFHNRLRVLREKLKQQAVLYIDCNGKIWAFGLVCVHIYGLF